MTVDEVKQLRVGDEIRRTSNQTVSKVVFVGETGLILTGPTNGGTGMKHPTPSKETFHAFADEMGMRSWTKSVPYVPFRDMISLGDSTTRISLFETYYGGVFHFQYSDDVGSGRGYTPSDLLQIRDLINTGLLHHLNKPQA